MDEAGVLGAFVEVGARRSIDLGRSEASGDAGAATISFPKSKEPDQRVVELVPSAAGRGRQLRHDVEAQLPERRIVAVDADLLRQPDIVGPRYLQILRETRDDVILLDVMLLALVKQTGDQAHSLVGRRREAQLVRLLLVAVVTNHELVW